MSLLRFSDLQNEIKPDGIFSEEVTLEGVTRPALRFRFNVSDFTLSELSEMFSSENCKKFTIKEEDGSEFIYENYSVRYRLATEIENEKDSEGNYFSQEFINITMAKKTQLEIAYEELNTSLEETQLALLEIYEKQEA